MGTCSYGSLEGKARTWGSSAHLVTLEDNLLQLTKRLKDILQIFLGDTEVNVPDV
jgi:hypothetical protein